MNDVMSNEEILNHIKKYSDNGKLSIFVGAGVSRLSGYPSWDDIVKIMAEEIQYKYEKDKNNKPVFSSEELLKIPQMYYIEKGEEQYTNTVKHLFQKDVKINKVHDLILSLNPTHILTTNYDTLIEHAALKFGRNFSVLNSNKSVAEVSSLNYIVKVHGDFSEKFVLKEQDYLDYENNYILIDNIVKTILSTNLVIFIGYGLNDYNIKLILNWVKNNQDDTYIKPVFIHTGAKLNDTEKRYYLSKGLCILDTNDFVNDNEDFLVKYTNILNIILDFKEEYNLSDSEKKLKYIYDKFLGINNLNYICREDFNSIFKNEYILDENFTIKNNNNKLDYFEFFFQNEKTYSLENKEMYEVVKNKLEKFNIKGMYDSNKIILKNLEINSISFINDYKEMKNFSSKIYKDIKSNYKKAYYLAKLGNFIESYDLYTKIVLETKRNNNWDIYYLSQINRHYLSIIIKNLHVNTEGINGVLSLGKVIKLFDKSFLQNLEDDMKNNVLEKQFDMLPYEFKNKYKFLKVFSTNNCYHNKYYSLSKNRYEVDKALCNNTIFCGLSKYDEIKLNMLETLKFIYENMILFDNFEENKIYIKSSITAWLEGMYKDVKMKEISTILNIRYNFNLTDIILISKTFKKNEIDYLIKKIDLNKIPFNQINDLENYIKNQMNNFSEKFLSNELSDGENIILHWFLEEFKNLLYISSYFISNYELIKDIISFLINNVDFQINEKKELIENFSKDYRTLEVYQLVEDWLYEYIEYIFDNEQDYLSYHIDDATRISELLITINEKNKFKSEKISNLIISNYCNIKNYCSIENFPYLLNKIKLLVDEKTQKNIEYNIDQKNI